MSQNSNNNAFSARLSITEAKSARPKTQTNKSCLTKCSTAFQLTINQPEYFDMIRDYLKSLKQFNYGIAAKEKAPSTGHDHVHLYAQFNRSVRLSLDKLHGAHVEKCKGSAQQNVDYVTKEGDVIWTEGTMKVKGGKSIKEVMAMPQAQRDELPFCYYNLVNKLNSVENMPVKVGQWHKEIKVFYIWGEPGIGKSKMAEELVQQKGYDQFDLVKFDGNFWHGVSGQSKAAIYDDWRDHHMKPYELINFIDYNIHPLNVKGSTLKNNYSLIIFTTIQDPSDIYSKVTEEQRNQWERRWKIIHMKKMKKNSN